MFLIVLTSCGTSGMQQINTTPKAVEITPSYNLSKDSLVNAILDGKLLSKSKSNVWGEEWISLFYKEAKFGIKHIPTVAYKSEDHWEFGAVYPNGEGFIISPPFFDKRFDWICRVSPSTYERLKRLSR